MLRFLARTRSDLVTSKVLRETWVEEIVAEFLGISVSRLVALTADAVVGSVRCVRRARWQNRD
jgi:hypothetical protein